MSLSELEKNYTPSQWSKRFSSSEIIERFHGLADEVIKKARATMKCSIDVPYGKTARTKYDIYGTDLPKDAPVFIFIHGGYFQESNRDDAGFTVPVLVANGIKVISLGYDVCPDVRLPDIVAEMKAGMEQILESAAKSGTRCIWICGHSAGAHLAADILHEDEWIDRLTTKGYFRMIKGILLLGGIYNLKPLVRTSFNEVLQLNDEEIKAFSLSARDTENKKVIKGVKVIAAVGECDSPIFVNETREYAQKLPFLVDNVEYILLRDNVDHFDIVENFMDPQFLLTKLVLQHMSPK